MAPFRRQGSLPRSAALISLGALAVHQLRYQLAYGGDAHAELARQGHGYLTQALPLLIAAAMAIVAAGLIRAALRPRRAAAGPGIRLAARAGLFALAIFAAFAIQETSEGLLFAGHASGAAAVFAGGGWLALPLALVIGSVAAILDGGLARLETLVARALPATPLPRAPRRHGHPAATATLSLVRSPLAFGLARRPPPLRA
jgi:hypothetical protein